MIDIGLLSEAERLLRLVLPMAKAYAHEHAIGGNQGKINAAEQYLNALADQDREWGAVRNLAIERDGLRRELAKACEMIALEHTGLDCSPDDTDCYICQFLAARQPKEATARCPNCGSNDAERCHHEADARAPECDYQQCMTCFHQWGHQ